METPQMIYTLIPAVMADIGAVGKDSYNEQQKFKFRGIDDVMNALKPILTRHQVFTVPEVLSETREVKTTKSGGELRYSLLRIKFSFYAPDGSHVDAVTLGEGMDSGDKASNKAMAIAYKYALFQTFCIPTEEMRDPDAETPPETIHLTAKGIMLHFGLNKDAFGALVSRLKAEGRIANQPMNDMDAKTKEEALGVIYRELMEPTPVAEGGADVGSSQR